MPTEKRRTRGRRRSREPEAARAPAAPVLLELDLADWAGDDVARAGRRHALLGRVVTLRLSPDGNAVEAQVRGGRPVPHDVRIDVVEDAPITRCTCSGDGDRPCRHAVAALEALRFPLRAPGGQSPTKRGRRRRGQGRIIQRAKREPGFVVLGGEERTLTKQERLALAEKNEIRERGLRARRERLSVTLLPSEGLPPRFSVGRRGASSGPYLVTLRGPKAELGTCTCPDFERNELGLCKHIERAKMWYLRKKKIIPEDLLSIWWRPGVWTERVPDPLHEIRLDVPSEELPLPLRGYFGPDRRLRSPPDGTAPSVWFARARAEAERVAVAEAWTFDLDAAIEDRLGELRRDDPDAGESADLDAVVASVTERLRLRLHPYQRDGLEFLARRSRAFLADDMGLGKTVQAIAAAVALRETVGAKKCLVVCPASLKYQWQAEIDKAWSETASVVEGRREQRVAAYGAWKSGFLIVNYELVLRDLDLLRAAGADIVVLDEAQRIKNWDTKTAKAVKQLSSPHAFVLTGTPLENRLVELHSLVEFLHPRALGPRWRLLPYHAVTDEDGRVVAYESLGVLRERLRPLFLRRDRQTVLDQLPDRTENTFWTEMTHAQLRPYRRHAARVARLLSAGQVLAPGELRSLLQSLTSMRILCNGLAQHAWDRFEPIVSPERGPAPDEEAVRRLHSPKLEEFVRVMDDLLEHAESKIVVFSQWERMLVLARYVLRGLLGRRGETARVFHGGLSAPARDRMLRTFRTDPKFRVLLSTDAGGLGLNLQDVASVVVHLEVPWNPAILEQRVARVHRLGQKRSVQVLNFVTRGAIEERVRRVVESKRALFESLLTEGVDGVTLQEADRVGFAEQVRELIGSEERAE